MATYIVTRTQVIECQQTIEADSAEEAIEFAQEDDEWELHETTSEKFGAVFEEWA
jgi:hypothetical protein